MTEFEALHRRRRYLLEQIGNAADEINAIDARLAFLRPPPLGEILSGSVSQP
jgi:hypothetical protein